MEIFLVRHGECENKAQDNYNKEMRRHNPCLTLRGEEQARKLAEVLSETEFDVMISSDLERAVATADAIAQGRSVKRICKKEFREIDMGFLEEKSWEDYPQDYAVWKLHKEDVAFPGGECGADVWERVQRFLMELVRKEYKRVAIVTHGGVIMSTVCGVLELPQQKRFLLGHPIENCSVTRLVYEDGRFYLKSLNEVLY